MSAVTVRNGTVVVESDLATLPDGEYVLATQHEAAPKVDDAMVERLARHLCREEWKDKRLSLDDMTFRMAWWSRFIPEARAALTAALTTPGGGS